MRPDVLLITEMIDAADQASRLADGITAEELEQDRQRRDALLWNFTVLGEAAAGFPTRPRPGFPDVRWQQPTRLRNRVVHGYWSIDVEVLHTPAAEQLPQFVRDLRRVLVALTAGNDDAGVPES
jgi:uncharacterized protein with HEPN domain